jgi:hypothetical protein
MIVVFGGRAVLRVEIDGAKNPESVIQVDANSNCEAACIRLLNEWFLLFDMLEDRCAGEGLFELSECGFGIPSAFPRP